MYVKYCVIGKFSNNAAANTMEASLSLSADGPDDISHNVRVSCVSIHITYTIGDIYWVHLPSQSFLTP